MQGHPQTRPDCLHASHAPAGSAQRSSRLAGHTLLRPWMAPVVTEQEPVLRCRGLAMCQIYKVIGTIATSLMLAEPLYDFLFPN